MKMSMKYKGLKIILMGVVCLLETGCPLQAIDQAAAEPDDMVHAQIELSQAAYSVNESLQTLARANPVASRPYPTVEMINPSLSQLVSVDWTGPVEPLLDEVAAITHYRIKVLGNPPALPVLVTLSVRDATAQDVLRDVQLQVNSRADVLIFPASGLIELHYL